MILKATSGNNGGGQKPTPGITQGTVLAVVDKGHQLNTYMKPEGSPDKWDHKVTIVFELPDHLFEAADGTKSPMVRCKSFNLSMFTGSADKEPSHFVKAINTLQGKRMTEDQVDGYDTDVLNGLGATLNLEESSKGKVNIGQIMPKQSEPRPLAATPYSYSIDKPAKNWGRLISFLQEDIRKSQEWPDIARKIEEAEAMADMPTPSNQDSDNLPF